MPVSLEFLRGLLGGLSIFFAHFFGRAVVKVSKGRERKRALYTWGLRFLVTAAAICYTAVDRLGIIVLALDAVAFGLGWWDEWRPKREEDLTRRMFPEDK
jgi:hypothetical protein